ncbi:MAG TPA: hypothetical protein EYP49_07835 [Anaerolineae bacterium]|nr:hypothetical protein [Anaerolineae bacterium]
MGQLRQADRPQRQQVEAGLDDEFAYLVLGLFRWLQAQYRPARRGQADSLQRISIVAQLYHAGLVQEAGQAIGQELDL